MAFINATITESIAKELTCITQDNINKAIGLGMSQQAFLFKVFFTVQDFRNESFFGDGRGTHGSFTLDVKDAHIYTMLKSILKIKGLDYKVSA